MILLCGIPEEPPLRRVAEELDAAGVPHATLDQRRWAQMCLEVDVVADRVGGVLDLGDARVALDRVRGVYTRLVDDTRLPDVRDEAPSSVARQACRAFHDLLVTWQEVTTARVLNRASTQASNGAKPYQAQLALAAGFSVPQTLVTNDPAAADDFRQKYGRVVYKSASGVRSIVRELTDDDLWRLPSIRWCPVQFQEYVEGTDVRVHVVGAAVFASEVKSDRTDYRYAESEGGSTRICAVELEDSLAERCVDLAHSMELPLAGLDLRMCPDGRVVCFEVNPSPAFTYYEAHTGQPIAAAVAALLAQ